MFCSFIAVFVLDSLDQHCKCVSCHVTLLSQFSIEFGQEAQQDLDQVHVSILVPCLLDGYKSFNTSPSVFNNSVDEGESVSEETFIGVNFVDD